MTPSDPTLAAVAAAYEGVEGSFAGAEAGAVQRYRESVLERTRPQADVIAPLVAAGARAVEIGCGNGRLLVELARRGVVNEALGLDVARSRIAFAEQWAADEALSGLRFEAEDALAAPLGEQLDLALCITAALGYFGAARPRLDGVLLERLAAALRPGGALVLELYPHPADRRLLELTGGEARTWRELDADDPWRFYLSHMRLEDGVMIHHKTFVHREDGRIDEGRQERLHLYDEPEIRALLEHSGFGDVRCREGWTDEPYSGGEVLVAIARRTSAQ